MTQSIRSLAKARSQFYRLIRDFFDQRDFVETETPILSTHLIPESAIEVFQTELNHPHRDSDRLYLVPSPELYMKQLISLGVGDCYQLAKVFRNSEHYSHRHLAEFTLLEWYAMNDSYLDNITTTQQLLTTLTPYVHPETAHYFAQFSEMTMAELFQQKVNIALGDCTSLEAFQDIAHDAGFSEYAAQAQSWEMLFHYIFISHIENELPKDTTLFIKDYPAQIATTAKRTGNYYERWEVYMKGWEIANCYTEEVGYGPMLSLFKKEESLKKKMRTPHAVDYRYLDIFKEGFPSCSGVALGIDRLFALFMNVASIEEVTHFALSETPESISGDI